jgi:uncharacterized SAM-binding protein YcdF (DUF218 family)
MITGALFLTVMFTPLVPLMLRQVTPQPTDVDHGVLVLLSGSAAIGGEPPRLLIGLNTYWRTMHAIAVWRAGHFSKILVCGYGTEEMVKPFLLAVGIPNDAILIENQSKTTHENALYAKPILDGQLGPYVLVTSDFHMYRAARCFEHEGIPVETMPAPDIANQFRNPAQRWECFQGMMLEFGATALYWMRGWI